MLWFKGCIPRMCMTELKLDVMHCSRCEGEWEYVKGEPQLQRCVACRLKINEKYKNRTPEVKARNLERCRVKYETDETFRDKVGDYVKERMRATTQCMVCEKLLKRGSLRGHRIACKGPQSKTIAQKILELSLSIPPLVESTDSNC
jgi:hypothetical protein